MPRWRSYWETIEKRNAALYERANGEEEGAWWGAWLPETASCNTGTRSQNSRCTRGEVSNKRSTVPFYSETEKREKLKRQVGRSSLHECSGRDPEGKIGGKIASEAKEIRNTEKKPLADAPYGMKDPPDGKYAK